jgi:hypothetical protein
MNIKEKIRDLAYKIDSSDKTTYLLTLCQVVGTTALALHSVGRIPSKVKPILLWLFITLQSLVAIILIFRSIFAGKYTTIKLIYNKATGVLFDRKIHARNISFRTDTVNAILRSVSLEKLFETGKGIGGDFYNCFQENLQQSGKSNVKITTKIEKWFDYDSSAGMGKFKCEAFEQQPFRLVLTITNPFTGTCHDQNNICEFLKGYVVGFCELLFNRRYLAITCNWSTDLAACKFTITESNRVLTM